MIAAFGPLIHAIDYVNGSRHVTREDAPACNLCGRATFNTNWSMLRIWVPWGR